MLSLLGLTGFQQKLHPYVRLADPHVRQIVKEQGMKNLKAELTWTPEAEQAFIALKTKWLMQPIWIVQTILWVSSWMFLKQETVHMGPIFKNRQGQKSFDVCQLSCWMVLNNVNLPV